jgi:hypothetical protein
VRGFVVRGPVKERFGRFGSGTETEVVFERAEVNQAAALVVGGYSPN